MTLQDAFAQTAALFWVLFVLSGIIGGTTMGIYSEHNSDRATFLTARRISLPIMIATFVLAVVFTVSSIWSGFAAAAAVSA